MKSNNTKECQFTRCRWKKLVAERSPQAMKHQCSLFASKPARSSPYLPMRKQGESRKRDITMMRTKERSFAQLTHDPSGKISERDKCRAYLKLPVILPARICHDRK